MNSLIISGIDKIKPFVSGGIFNKDKKKNDIIYLISLYINEKGWNLKFNGNNCLFNSYELFEFMTDDILAKNIKLDDIIVYNFSFNEKFEGGYWYFYLRDYLPSFLNADNNNNNNNNRDNSNYAQSNQYNNNNNINQAMFYNSNINNTINNYGGN